MSDFHQGGVITTLHRLGAGNLDSLEGNLEKSPSISSIIIEQLPQVRYRAAVDRDNI